MSLTNLPEAVSAPLGDRTSATEKGAATEPAAVDAGEAQFCGWLALALLNQVLILILVPPSYGIYRLLHHLYDAGQLVAMGAVSLVVVRSSELALMRVQSRVGRAARWLPALAMAALVFGVSMSIVNEDIANLADRYEIKEIWVSLAASLMFALVLSSSLIVRRFARGRLRAGVALLGVALAVGNALILEADYFALHLMAAWLGALLIGFAVEGLTLPLPKRRTKLALVAALALGGVASLVLPPPNEVLRCLYSLPSSAVAPVASRFLPEQRGAALERVPPEYLNSPWFEDRGQLPPVAATRTLEVEAPMIVLLFTIDAFRADVLEDPEHNQKLPHLNALRRESTYFTQARSPTPSTWTTMASLFTGRYYSSLRWAKNPSRNKPDLVDEAPRFPAVLQKQGVHTVIVQSTTLGRIDAESGVATGFNAVIQLPRTKKYARLGVDKIIEQIENRPPGHFFLFNHFIEPHLPYDLGGTKGTPFQRYVREIAIVDKEIGRLRKFLKDNDLERRTVLVISADHGEGMGEHGLKGHARNVYEETVRVPLFVQVPGAAPREVSEMVTLLDIFPTMMDLFGLPTPPRVMGQSLLPVVAGKQHELSRPVAVDAGRRIQAFYFKNDKKVIFDLPRHVVEVYDLKHDPLELKNLVEQPSSELTSAIETAKLFFQVQKLKVPGQETPWVKF